ncbi:CRISPR-associated endonuclease Cas2, partial [Pelomicrobium sp. G1]|uniref:CRISPR-associated endonuclease Cas2 n=1 Tax=Pelomicrobium sp. G1 TaxID=3452920 RepID=UPI003F76AF35
MIMHGYGERFRLSGFQCRLSRELHAELSALLDGIIHHGDDHMVLLDLGLAERVVPRFVSLGKTFTPIE